MLDIAIVSITTAVLSAEIWDPTTNQFKFLRRMTTPRTYHSVALLLKDGRVLAGGGGLCGENCAANHPDVEILVPPYLLDTDGNMVTDRPQIVASPSTVAHGESITIELDTSEAHTFALMRLGAATHSVNNDSRRIPLTTTSTQSLSTGHGLFTFIVPSNPSIALPGTYFLFAMNAGGVPSVGATISISSTSANVFE